MNPGISLAMLSAIIAATNAVVTKILLTKVDRYIALSAVMAVQAIILLLFLPIAQIPPLSINIILFLIITLVIDLIATSLYMDSVKHHDISQVIPILSFTPLFMLFFGALFYNENPSSFGFIGVLLVVIGSYFLHAQKKQEKIYTPFKKLLTHKGTQYMLITAVLWAITNHHTKIGVRQTSPLFLSLIHI